MDLVILHNQERFIWDSHNYDQDWRGDSDGKGSGYQMFKSIHNTISGEMAHEPG